jgi:hypothetical protein
MASERARRRYRKLYAVLLRLYPGAFHRRFAQSMEQTFDDLCRECETAGGGLFTLAVGLFVETFSGILRERIALIMPPRENIVRLALITAFVLSVPLVGTQVSDEVDWSPFDFVAASVLLFGTGFAFELIARRSSHLAYRAGTGLACAAVLLLIWINLAVGLIGSEDNPANGLYLGVLCVVVLGAFIARLRPRPMARALYATALAQALVPVLALIIFEPQAGDGTAIAGLVQVFILNTFFVLLFVGSGTLFGIAGQARQRPREPDPDRLD